MAKLDAARMIESMKASMKSHRRTVNRRLKLKISAADRRRKMAELPSDGKRYNIQRSGRPGHSATCSLIALANARTYFGHPSVRPGSSRWSRLVNLGRCIAGPCIDVHAMAIDMGLSLRPTSSMRQKNTWKSLLRLHKGGFVRFSRRTGKWSVV